MLSQSKPLNFMTITIVEAVEAIESAGFTCRRSTSKIIEFEYVESQRVLYLRKGQGFPERVDIAIHPDFDTTRLTSIPEVQANKRSPLRFSSNMTGFPKRLNNGLAAEHFGKALSVFSARALSKLCLIYRQ